MESVETRVIPNHGQRRELQRDWRKETEGERREKEEEANLRGRNERRFWRERGTTGWGYSVRRNAAKGRKKFLTCLRYIRESGSSRYFTRVSEVAKQTPPTLSLSPSPPYFAPLVQPAILPSSAVASLRSIHSPCFYCCVEVLHVVYPFARGFTFVWRWKWTELRLVETATSFNWDAEPQLQCVYVRVYIMCMYARVRVYIFENCDEIRDVCYICIKIYFWRK